MQGYSDLHDSLEGAMAQVEIEPVGSEGTHKSGQEVQLIRRLDQTSLERTVDFLRRRH